MIAEEPTRRAGKAFPIPYPILGDEKVVLSTHSIPVTAGL